MRTLIRVVLIFIGTFIVVAGWGWFNIWRSPKFASDALTLTACQENPAILSMEQYGAVGSHARPYVVERPDLVLFGAEHTKDPDDPQIARIESAWAQLDPTVALVEGRLGFLIPYVMNPVPTFGESGYVAKLARSDGAAIYSWELPKSELILELVKVYPPEQVALSQVLSPYFSNYRFGKPDDPEAFVAQFLNRAHYPGLENTIGSIDDIDQIWQQDFADVADWRETSDQWGLPGYLGEIAASANMIRNQHLACVIDGLVANGERVFVIAGSSHAVCLDPAL